VLGIMIVDAGTWLLEHKLAFLPTIVAIGVIMRLLLRWKTRRDAYQLHRIERAALGITDRELELASKLLQTLHLSVPERHELPSGRLRLSVLVAAARADLARGSFLPSRLRPSDTFAGALLELRDDTYWIHKQYEVGVTRHSPTVSMPASDLKDAVQQYVEAYGADRIDGVRIDLLA
jgi:hypothetical protein